jgi:hypothetical protein
MLYLRPLICKCQEFALEIYRNATIEKVAYIRHLMNHADKEDESFARWQLLLVVRLLSLIVFSPPVI